MPENSDRIFFRGIVLFARHGVHPEEARMGQRFEIDLDCFLEMRRYSLNDDHARAVSYANIYDTVRELVEDRRFSLIEALGECIADGLFARFAALDAVRIEIRKPAAPVAGVFDTVGIELTRTRQSS